MAMGAAAVVALNDVGRDLDFEIRGLIIDFIPNFREDWFFSDNEFYSDPAKRETYWEVACENIEEIFGLPQSSWTNEQVDLLTDSIFALYEYRRLYALVRVPV